MEFAKEAVEKGQDTVTAALTAAHLRPAATPIVMTSLAFILGLLPLVFASGPGSASRQGIGTGVFFGMLVAILRRHRLRPLLLRMDLPDQSKTETMKRNPLAFFCLLRYRPHMAVLVFRRAPQCKAPELNLSGADGGCRTGYALGRRYEMVAVLRRYAIVQDHRADASLTIRTCSERRPTWSECGNFTG